MWLFTCGKKKMHDDKRRKNEICLKLHDVILQARAGKMIEMGQMKASTPLLDDHD
jgi:hypothetical protein